MTQIKPLRSAAVVMLAIAFLDGVLKLIEFIVGAELWRVMLAMGLVLIAVDALLSHRGNLGGLAWTTLRKLRQAIDALIAWLTGRVWTRYQRSERRRKERRKSEVGESVSDL